MPKASLGGGSKPHHLLADIAAGQHVDERGWSRLESLGDRLVELEPAGAEPIHQLVERLVTSHEVAANAEPTEHDTPVEDDTEVAQPLTFACVVLRYLPAHGHARIHVEVRHHHIQDVSTH